MTYIANWTTFEINQTPADQSTALAQAQSVIYWLKTQLVSVGWSVVSSSNSYVSGASDLWTSGSALNWNFYSYARSWCLLKSPIGFIAGPDGLGTGDQSRMYICLECVEDSNYGFVNTRPQTFNVSVYSTLPSGGSTTAKPSGGNSQSLTPYTTATYFLPQPTVVSSRMHFASTSSGGFYFSLSGDGTGIMYTLLYFLPLVNVNNYGSLPYPYAAIFGFLYSNTAANFYENLFDTDLNGFVCGWNYDGTPGHVKCLFMSSGGTFAGSDTTTTGDMNGNLFFVPMYVYNYVGGYNFNIGQIPDFYINNSISYANGSTAPISTVNYCNIAYLWFPTNTAFSL